MIYPFFTSIGNMKVTNALPLLEFISADWHLSLAILPSKKPEGNQTHYKMLEFGRRNSFLIAHRILKNSARNN